MGIVKYGIVSHIIGHVEYAIIGISVMFPFMAIATLSYRLKKSKADLSSVTRGVASQSRPCDKEEVDG